ncbi:prolyl oligopeptidase family serine peptidase [Lentisphaera marina]|uniref:prolyl oligopeptidase family serine peptidase n=1 Tax=Lentisphaera marina TaxID=1111041 RepID=UPI00236699B2|nr:prolyl oligopeptidase family serine peptidase [Lentisphaera marina]MDD7983782.1 prolyl oligopeptidase family serine peptidase [Lentisphaera marina]
MKIIYYTLSLIISLSLFGEKHRTGKYSVTDKAIPRPYYESVHNRWPGTNEKIPDGERIPVMTIKDKKFDEVTWDIEVPESYDPNIPAGIISYITPGSGKAFISLLEKYNLILITAKNSGNDTYTYARISMALWGVDKLKESYNIDSDRIFISGMSGGGRVSSIAAALFPEVYKGAIYQCGCNFVHNNEKSRLNEMKENYFYFLTGDGDFNLEDTQRVLKKYTDAKIPNTKIHVQKNHKHRTLPTDILDKALAYIDTPRVAKLDALYTKGMSALNKKQFPEAFKSLQIAASAGHEKAIKEFDKLKKSHDQLKEKITLSHKENDYVEAYKSIQEFVSTYGKEMAKDELLIIEQYKKNPAILKEFKADAYLQKIKIAMKKKGSSKDKIEAGLKKILEQCPNTKTAERAQELLDQKVSS